MASVLTGSAGDSQADDKLGSGTLSARWPLNPGKQKISKPFRAQLNHVCWLQEPSIVLKACPAVLYTFYTSLATAMLLLSKGGQGVLPATTRLLITRKIRSDHARDTFKHVSTQAQDLA